MGLLSSLQSFVSKNVSAATRDKVVSAVDTALTVLTSPIAAIKDFSKAKEETSKKSTLKLVAEGVENTLLVVAPFSSAGKTLATKAVATAFGSVKATATTLVVGGAIASSPTVRNTAISLATPSNLIGTGEKIGNFVEKALDSNVPGVEDLTKGSLTALAGLGVGGLALAGGKLLYDDIQDGGLIDSNNDLPTERQIETFTPETIPTNAETPALPETTTISVGEKKKYKRKKAKSQNINQRVNINISQRNSTKLSTKRYLNSLSY